MTNIVKLELGLDLTKNEDKEAYYYLKTLSAAERKSTIIDSILFKLKQSKFPVLLVLKLFATVVSVLLVVLSIHFTYDHNNLVMPSFWALLLSIALVVFTSFALTVSTYTKGLTFHLFRLLWVIGITYSVFTAFAGQYDSFRSYVSLEASTDKTSLIKALADQEQSLISDIEQLRSSQEPYAALIEDLSSSPEKKVDYPQTWRDANVRFDALQAKIDAKQAQLDELRSKQLDCLDTSSSVSTTTVYTWLSRLIHIPADVIELFILFLPSCFIDLASSLLLKFALGKSTERK